MRPGARSSICLLTLLVLINGCGHGLMQTAKTAPAGELEMNLSAGYIHNEMVENRGHALTNMPVQLGLRYGITDQVDVGASVFMGAGALLDGKYNFMPADHALALSLQAGLGLAYGLLSDNTSIVELPMRALISYQLPNARLTPYAGIGLTVFWVNNYEPENAPAPDQKQADRAGYGDGMLLASLGVELFSDSAVQMLLEYSYFRPVFDDPGDNFSFVDNHIFQVGMKF